MLLICKIGLTFRQADAIQLEDAVVAAGMPPAPFYNQGRDTALPPVTSLCSLLMLFRRKMASSAISLKRQPFVRTGLPIPAAATNGNGLESSFSSRVEDERNSFSQWEQHCCGYSRGYRAAAGPEAAAKQYAGAADAFCVRPEASGQRARPPPCRCETSTLSCHLT